MPHPSSPPAKSAGAGVTYGALLIAALVSGCDATVGVHEASGTPRSAAERPESQPALGACLDGDIARRGAALTVVDRTLVGSPASYDADPMLRERETLLRSSQRARREAAWQIAERVLAPVHLPEGLVSAAARATLPTWQTWHAKDDVTRIFRHLYPTLSAAERASRTRFSPSAIAEARRWNDGAIDDFADWTFERLLAYQSAVGDELELHGLGGIYRVSYNEAASSFWLGSYPEVLGCRETDAVEGAELDGSGPGSALCRQGEPQPECLSGDFPVDAVMVKASWRRVDGTRPLPVFDTSADALERRLTTENAFAWGTPDAYADPSSRDIYTLQLPNGNRYRLAGLHIMTKELDQWFWTTLWWSPRPDEDFGADRPSTLPLPWRNYKLCAVAAFDEADPDPGGGFDSDHPSLALALAATHASEGGPTWCSNPYLEEGEGNAATNCIGCHQHAGTRLSSEQILADAERFPDFGRTEQRAAFPSDYAFAGDTGDNLGAMFEETEDHFE